MPKKRRFESTDADNEMIVALSSDDIPIDANQLISVVNDDDANDANNNNHDDVNNCNLRRKSKRIAKPRSLDASPVPNQNHLSAKKFGKTQQLLNVNTEHDKQTLKNSKSDDTPQSSKVKSSRKWEMWTQDYTKWFFEAICEHGKDFTRIQSYMAQRSEKKGKGKEKESDLIKNKDQVRHYYYRTWHKLANSLNITDSNVIDKGTQEIYGLINYGEIWKKFGTKFDSKLGQHLQELVHYGHTIIKVKGKSFRIKTPICKALKKIHNIDTLGKSKPSNPKLMNLPKEICIELHPSSNSDWLRVHSLSQNPRVRTRLSLQKRLSSLIEYLEKRWNPSRVKDTECLALCGAPLPEKSKFNMCFRVRPLNVDDLKNVSFTRASLLSSHMDLSLGSYLKKLFNNNDDLIESKKKQKGGKSKDKNCDETKSDGNLKSPENVNDSKNSPSDANDDEKILFNEKSEDDDEPIAEAERSLTLLKMLASMNEERNETGEEIQATDEEDEEMNKDDDDREVPSPESNNAIGLPSPPANATLAQWLSGIDDQCDDEHGDDDRGDDDHGEDDNPDNRKCDPRPQMSTLNLDDDTHKSQISAESARKGWTSAEAASLTIGELYLLFKCPKKIILEYLWEPSDTNDPSKQNSPGECPVEESSKPETPPQHDVLSKLLFTANLTLQNLKRRSNSFQTARKKRRIKPTPVPITNSPTMVTTSSQLLSSLISNTILSNNETKRENIYSDNCLNGINSNNYVNEKHKFIVPTSPAPKAANKTKNRNCGDPALIQEALRQLQSTKYTKRHRRPTPKPVFAQHNKPLLPRGSPASTSSTSSHITSQPIYMIPQQQIRLNTITTISSPSPVINQVIPVIANVTAINTNNMTASNRDEPISAGDSLNAAILLQHQSQPIVVTQTNGNTLFNTINSHIPLIQNATHLLSPAAPVPNINPSIPTLRQFQNISVHSQALTPSSSAPISVALNLTEAAAIPSKSDDTPISTMTMINDVNSSVTSINLNSNEVLKNNLNSMSIVPSDSNSSLDSLIKSEPLCHDNDEIKSSLSTPLLTSPPLISSILDISLPEPPPVFGDNSCSSLTLPEEETLNNNKRPFGNLNASISRPVTNDPILPEVTVSSSSSLSSPPFSRLKSTFPVSDPQWLNGESSDISIGTLLNAYESQCKTAPDVSSLSNEVDTQMSCLVNDNSVDLMAKFADLAAQIVDSNSKST